MKKLKKNQVNVRNKNMSYVDRERKKIYMKNYYSTRKILLNHLIIRVKELENVCLNKYIVKYHKNLK